MKFGPMYILGTTLGNSTDTKLWDIIKVHAEVDEMYPGKTNISCCLKYLNIRGQEYTKVPSIYAGRPNAATKLSAYHYTCLNPKTGVVPDGVALTVSQFTCSEEDVTYRKPDTPLTESEIKLAVCTKVAYGSRSAELIIEFMEAYRYLGVDKFTCYILEDLNEDAQKVLAYYASIGIMDAYIHEPAAWGNIRIYHECEGGIEKFDPRITEACRVKTNVDREGRIFLSHPHTNNGVAYCSCSPLNISFYIKGFQIIMNSQKSDMVTSFYNHNDATGRRATSTRPFVFYLSLGLVRVCEINRSHHWCSVGTEKSQPEGPPFQWETRLAEFPTGTVDPRVRIYLEPLNTNDRFFFSYTTTVRYRTV